MHPRSTIAGAVAFTVLSPLHSLGAQACYGTPTSMTPPTWRAPSASASKAPSPGLKLVREVPLPGPANRFDYQSVDPSTGRIYMNHMNARRTIVFDADSSRVVTEIADVPRRRRSREQESHTTSRDAAKETNTTIVPRNCTPQRNAPGHVSAPGRNSLL